MTNQFDPIEHPHRRFNPLLGEWVQVSPHRMKRPWQGKVETPPVDNKPSFDPKCYLCPGNGRAGGFTNPDYESIFVFTNDYAALLPDVPPIIGEPDPLMRSEAMRGTCRVVCFSPRHDLTLPEMPAETILKVIEMWSEQAVELGKTYKWVQLFQNKGALMGSSNPHPHGQIWALDALPNQVAKEEAHQRAYHTKHNSVLLVDYVKREMADGERTVLENDDWLVVVPYWAIWPFETLLMPKRHVLRVNDLVSAEKQSLAQILKQLLIRYDNLFEVAFPYSMGWHGAPWDDQNYDHWQLHAHFLPPLLRSATVRKFMVGYELLGESQRDLTAEQAAKRLRELPDVHYKQTR